MHRPAPRGMRKTRLGELEIDAGVSAPATERRAETVRNRPDGQILEHLRQGGTTHRTASGPEEKPVWNAVARLRQLGLLTDDNLLIFRDRTPKGRHYTERRGAPPTRLQDSSFGAGCFGNAQVELTQE